MCFAGDNLRPLKLNQLARRDCTISNTPIPDEVGERHPALYTGVVSDVLDSLGLRDQALPHYIMPVTTDMVVAGPALKGRLRRDP
jgi:hypothetical protein